MQSYTNISDEKTAQWVLQTYFKPTFHLLLLRQPAYVSAVLSLR